jgi:hypothetical protein
MTIANPPTNSIDAERLAGFQHTLRTMLRDRVPPLGNDATSAAHHRAHVESLEEALGRIDDGTYGRCVWCESVIPPERLEVVPAAPGCQACTTEREGQQPPRP